MTAGTSGQAAEPTTRVVARGGEVRIVSAPVSALRSGEVEVATEHSVISPGTERTIIEATRSEGWLSHEYPAADQDWPRRGRRACARTCCCRARRRRSGPRSATAWRAGSSRSPATLPTSRPATIVACAGSQCAFHAARVVVPRSLTVPVPAGLGTEKAAFVTLGRDRARSAAARPADPGRDDRRIRLRRARASSSPAGQGGRHLRHRGGPASPPGATWPSALARWQRCQAPRLTSPRGCGPGPAGSARTRPS